MSPVAAPADRRFRRAHIKPGRKRGRIAALIRPALKGGALAALTLYALYRGSHVMAHASMLQIDRLVVRGNARLSSGEVLTVLGGLRGQNIVLADLDAWRRTLLASPWVRDAALRRSLPSTVEIVITEREPIAVGRIGGDLYLVDDGGVVIDQYGPQYAALDLPIVDGLETAGDGEEGRLDELRAAFAARLIVALQADPDVAAQVSQVDVSDLRNASVILTGDPAVIYVGNERFLPRLRGYLQLAAALRERVPDIDYVDLRFDDRIYVRPAGRR